MTDDRLNDRLWSVPVPETSDAEERTVAACRARARTRAVAAAVEVPGSPARWRPRRMIALAFAGALALVVAAAVLRGADSARDGASLNSFAALAADQPVGEFQHVAWESLLEHSWPPRYVQGADHPETITQEQRVEIWAGADQHYERGTSDHGRGEPNLVSYLTDRPSGLSCFPGSIAAGTRVVFEDGARVALDHDVTGEICIAGTVNAGLWSGPDLPTDPEALRAALEDELRGYARGRPALREARAAEGSPGRVGEPAPDQEAGACELPPREAYAFALPVPLSQTVEWDRQGLASELGVNPYSLSAFPMPQQVFSRALVELRKPLASPELRAALFEVLAGIDGVVLTTGQEDSLGREAALVTYETEPVDPGDKATIRDELYVDPATSQVLEIRSTVESTEDAAPDERVSGTYVELYAEREPVDSLPPEAGPLEEALEETLEDCLPA